MPEQNFSGANITTGKGGIFTSPSPSAGSGGDVGSGNSNFGLQDFSDSTLKTGDGGNATNGGIGADGGNIGSNNKNTRLQDFTQATLTTGAGGFSNISGAKGSEGGTIASDNSTPALVQRFDNSNITTGDFGGDVGSGNL